MLRSRCNAAAACAHGAPSALIPLLLILRYVHGVRLLELPGRAPSQRSVGPSPAARAPVGHYQRRVAALSAQVDLDKSTSGVAARLVAGRLQAQELASERDLRSVWRLLPAALAQDLLLGFIAFPYQVASCSLTSVAKLWRTRPDGVRRFLYGHRSEVRGVRFFPLGDRALTWSDDATVRIWDVGEGRAVHVLRHPGHVRVARVFPDGRRMATCSGRGAVTIWDTHSGKVLWRLRMSFVKGLEVFESGERLLLWGASTSAIVLDARSGDVVCSFSGHSHPISAAALLPDGDGVATGDFDGVAWIWRCSTCEALHRLDHDGKVTGVVALDRGSTVVTSTEDGSISSWDVLSGRRLHTKLRDPTRVMNSVRGLLPIAGSDAIAYYCLREVVVWNATSGRVSQTLTAHPHWIENAVVAPGGDYIVACSGSAMTIWEAGTGRQTHVLQDQREAPGHASGGAPTRCSIAIGPGAAFDPHGFGLGQPWRTYLSDVASAAVGAHCA